MQSVTGLSYTQGLMLFAFIVILYTAIGGFKAVVATDTLQGIIMTIGSFLLIFFIISAGGGMANITATLDSINPGWDILGKGAAGEGIKALQPGYIISFWVLVGVAVMGLPQTAVRCMGFKDTKSMHRAMLYGTVVVGILMIGTHFAGALALPLVADAGLKSTDAVIPYVVMNYMPTWAAGLFLAAPLAAVMSTVSSLLILASATIVKEVLVKYVWKDNKNEKLIPKISYLFTLLIGLVALIIAISPPSIIVWINLFAMGGLEATFFWALIGGLYWKKGSKYCCYGSIISGVFTFVFFNQVKILPYNIHEIVPAIIISGIVYYIIGRIRNEEPSKEVLKNCF